MTNNEANEKYWEPIFEDAIHKVASCNSQIYSKLIIGLQAERDLFERKCEDMAAELATLKQRKMATSHARSKLMTSDEHLAKCIKAIARTMCRQVFAGLHGVTRFGPPETLRKCLEVDIANHWREWIEKATEVFDSLHGVARVVPIEATEEMIDVAIREELTPYEIDSQDREAYAKMICVMSAAGDLTNPPEGKP